jgi:ureidoglycolate lyase
MSVRFETLNVTAFRSYGSVIPAGTPHDHLLDAQIFQSCQNQMRPNNTAQLGSPRIRILQSDPWRSPFKLPKLYKNQAERVIFAPISTSQYLLCVAKDNGGEPYQPRAFLLGASLAINIKAGIWYSQLVPLHKPARHVVVDSYNTDSLLEQYKFPNSLLVLGMVPNAA